MTYQLPNYKANGQAGASDVPSEAVGSWAGLAIVVSLLSAPLTFFIALYVTGNLMNLSRSLAGDISIIVTILMALMVIVIGSVADLIVNRRH